MLDLATQHSPSIEGLSEYGNAFIDYLKGKELEGIIDWDRIINACKKSEEHVLGKNRKNGDVSESHPYEVTKIYVELHGNKISENGLIAALLHDYVEDNSNSQEEHQERVQEIENEFGIEVGILVDLLSKPHFSHFIGTNEREQKNNRNEFYFGNYESLKQLKKYVKSYTTDNDIRGLNSADISKAAFIIGAIKLCDRIHNLITLDNETYTQEKIVNKIKETEKYLIPLAHSLHESHPYILDRIRDAITKAKRRIPELERKKVKWGISEVI